MKLTLTDIALRLVAPLVALASLTGCNGLIYDDEGDCDPYYKVKFVYDTNLKFIDAFATEVSEVTLYVIDPATGNIVWQRHEEGEALRSGNYMMDVDVAPGTYDLIAWCGEGHTSSFTVADATLREGLRCRLTDREAAPAQGEAHVRNELRRLFHGKSRNVEFEDGQGVHIKTVRLIKDTNDLHIMLQHLSGEDVDHRDFTMTVTGTNGHMDWDNTLLPDDKLTYFAHTMLSGTAGVEVPDYTKKEEQGRVVTQVAAAVGHLSLSRLMDNDDLFVKIYNKEGEQIVSIPLSQYALLVKGNYKHPDGTPLTNQEYLDYQDDYSMVFFLDENGRWVNTEIFINSWRVLLQNVEI